MLSLSEYILLFAVFLVLAFLYHRMEEKHQREEEQDKYAAIRKYLLQDRSLLENAKQPILWIHVPHEYNARHWSSFGSRSSLDLNQPYLLLTLQSILRRCADSFHVCIVDDTSFAKLLPSWDIDLSILSAPVVTKMRYLGITKLLHTYGGLWTPLSFVCFRDLHELYMRHTADDDKLFVVENVNRHASSAYESFCPDPSFLGCSRGSGAMEAFHRFLQTVGSTDNTAASAFLGRMSEWCRERQREGQVTVVDGKLVGTKTNANRPLLLEDLMSSQPLDVCPQAYGLWVPAHEILSRRHYEWFARLSTSQALEANTALSQYLLLAQCPEGACRLEEPMSGPGGGGGGGSRPPWVGFWKVASGAPVWGVQPLNQGDETVRRIPYPDN